MVEFLNETILWWHWIIFGLILLIIEMNLGTFIMLGLGIAGIIVGVIDVLVGLSFSSQLLLWVVFSILFILAWFKWLRQSSSHQAGQSDYGLDILGTVNENIELHKRGKVTFDAPVLGNRTWSVTSKNKITKNERVKIVQVNGQLIEVESIK
jgi:membrane protein implicated in regulation of membrane protease activity